MHLYRCDYDSTARRNITAAQKTANPLKVEVGDIVEYTIDAIKYIDGTEIKDVVIDGNKTVKAGIKTEDQLVAEFTTPNIGTNSISFFSTINDKRDLIAYSNGIIKAVIYDGEAIVAEKTLSTAKTEVVFDNLKTNSLYQYAIVAYYDDLSGIGGKADAVFTSHSATHFAVVAGAINHTLSHNVKRVDVHSLP